MSDKGDKAYGYFTQGYNCSQAVAMAFSEELGLRAVSAGEWVVCVKYAEHFRE